MNHSANLKPNMQSVLRSVKASIFNGAYKKGTFLPPIRNLSSEYGVSPETIRRGLKVLEKEGLLGSVPRHGFKVLIDAKKTGSLDSNPLVYIAKNASNVESVSRALSIAMNDMAASKAFPVFNLFFRDTAPVNLADQVERSKAWGVVIDTVDADLLDRARTLSVPTVFINSWSEHIQSDSVVQDNYQGGYMAADYFTACSAKRVGWISPPLDYCHTRERFAGLAAGLMSSGYSFNPADFFNTADEDVQERLLTTLKSTEHPDAFFIHSLSEAKLIRRVSDQAGLEIGKDLHIVGWTINELYDDCYLPIFKGLKRIPPAVTWNAADMVENAHAILEARKSGWTGTPRRICIPVQLRKREKK